MLDLLFPPKCPACGRYTERRDTWCDSCFAGLVSLDIRFAAYLFSGTEPNKQSIYWTNIPELISEIEATNNNQYDDLIWAETPLTVQLGRGDLLRGLEEALIGCHDQDSVQVYMTSAAAYGKQVIGAVQKDSSVAWYIKILNVTK